MKFQFEAIDSSGKSIGGQLDADTERAAQRELRRRGLTPVSIASANAVPTQGGFRFRSSITARDHMLAVKELATLLKAGVTLAESFQFMANAHAGKPLAAPLDAIGRALRQGVTLSAAMRQHLPGLPAYVHQLAEGGEMTGQLPQALTDAVAQMEYEHKLRTEVRNALLYPCFLMIAGIAAVLFIFTVVLPNVAGLLRGDTSAMPWLARTVLGAGQFVGAHQSFVIISVLGLLAAPLIAMRQPALRQRALEAAMRLPVVGPWLIESETARWSGLLSTLLLNQVPLLNGLAFAREAVASPRLRTGLAQVERTVRGGGSLSQALQDYTVFPAVAVNLVRLGERAGNLGEMLRSAATLYEASSRDRSKKVLLLMEPVAIVVIGLAIGIIVLGVFEAITSINNIPL